MGKLCQYIIENLPTDIEIILFNSNDTISIKNHKHILACYFDYFHKLFNFGKSFAKAEDLTNTLASRGSKKEKNQSPIRIEVPNPKIAHDLILSHGKFKMNPKCNEIKYLLEMFKCRNFFCLKNDVAFLYDIEVSSVNFELFMEVIDEFDFINDKYLMRTIKKNIPLDYDLSKFTIEFIKELQMNNYVIALCSNDGSIKLYDVLSSKLLVTLEGHTNKVLTIAFSLDNLKIASGSSDHSIKISDIQRVI